VRSVRFCVLGPVEVYTGDGPALTLPRRRERCLLAILLLEAGRVVPIDRLCELLWEDNPPQQPHRLLRSHIARIRALLARAGAAEHGITLTSQQRGYVLKVDPDTVDVHQFRRLLHIAGRTSDLAERDRLLREALTLWRGPALHHAATDRLRQRLCADLDEQRLRALEEWIAIGLSLGRDHEFLPELAQLNAQDPVRERLIELHMRTLYRLGRTAEALEVYRQARTRLADGLGLDPGPVLQRLHQAILRGEDASDPDIAPVRPAQLPSDLATFAGRSDHLTHLDTLLSTNPTAVVISAIAGTAGVGKTALAIHWAHRVREQFPDGQLHIDLRGYSSEPPLSPLHALARFLRALGVPAKQVPVDIDEAAATYRTLLADKRVLVVLDNALSASQVRPLLPGSPTCRVLITSRDRLDGLVVSDGARRIALDGLTAEESVALLAAIVGHERVYAELDASYELARLCAHLPLALRICAALLGARPGRRIAEFVADIDRADRLDHLAVPGDPDGAVRAAFDLSYRTLRPATRELFRRFGLVPVPGFTAAAAAALVGTYVEQAQRLLEELAAAHLVNEHSPGRYGLHDLLHCYALERVGVEESASDQATAAQRLCRFYLRGVTAAARLVYPEKLRFAVDANDAAAPRFDNRDTAMQWLNAERTNLIVAVQYLADHGLHPTACQLAHAFAGYLAVRGYTVEGLAVAKAGFEAADRDNNPAARAQALLDLAAAHFLAEQYDPALEHYTTALALCRQVGWREGQADALNGLAFFHWETEQLDRAADYHREAVELNRAAGRPTGEAASLTNLGSVHLQRGRYAPAADCFNQAATLFREAGALWGEGMALTALGQLDHDRSEHEQAHQHFLAALNIHRRTGDQRTEAETLTGLASVQLELGRYEKALESARAAVSLAASTRTQRTEADARNTLGRIHAARSDHRAAIAEHRTALQIATDIAHRRARAHAHLGLAAALCAENRHDEALDHADAALTIAREAGYHPLEAQAITALADIQILAPIPGQYPT
jgi:DNA-binding SARP family transcriptional activator